MNVAALNIRIKFQRKTTLEDKFKNHRNVWEDFYKCSATATFPQTTPAAAQEKQEAAVTVMHDKPSFTVRYCPETAAVTSDGFRVVMGEKIYDILDINPMGFKKKSLKFDCKEVQR